MKLEKHLMTFSMMTSFCGVVSFVVFCTVWYILSGVFNCAFFMAALPFILCWSVAGIIAWFMIKTPSKLGIATYALASMLFGLMCTVFITTLDSSVRAWLFIAIIGFFICSLPSYLLLRHIGIPKLFDRKQLK
ncbi:MAG: hypothetical protein K2L45_12850 [Muribaculaceae bacterium]|nr:hypothetical protein [Muribaculaceae bacterium]